MGQQAELGG